MNKQFWELNIAQCFFFCFPQWRVCAALSFPFLSCAAPSARPPPSTSKLKSTPSVRALWSEFGSAPRLVLHVEDYWTQLETFFQCGHGHYWQQGTLWRVPVRVFNFMPPRDEYDCGAVWKSLTHQFKVHHIFPFIYSSSGLLGELNKKLNSYGVWADSLDSSPLLQGHIRQKTFTPMIHTGWKESEK